MNDLEDHSVKINIFDITDTVIKKLNVIIICTIIFTVISFLYTRTTATSYSEKLFLSPNTFLLSQEYANFNIFANKIGLNEITSKQLFNQSYELLTYKQEIKNQIMLSGKINSKDFLIETEYEKEIIKFAKDRFDIGTDEFGNFFVEISGDINEREDLTKILLNAWASVENNVKNYHIERINSFIINYESNQQYKISDINDQILRLKEMKYKKVTTSIKNFENKIIQKKEYINKKLNIDRNYLNEQINISRLLKIENPRMTYLNPDDKTTVNIDLAGIQDPYFLRGYILLEKELKILEKKLLNVDLSTTVDMIDLDDSLLELEFYRNKLNDPTYKSEELVSLENEVKKINDNLLIDRFKNEYLKTALISAEKKFTTGKISDKTIFIKFNYQKRIIIIALLLSFFFSTTTILFIEYYFRYKNKIINFT